jgi:twitching motility protein PilT
MPQRSAPKINKRLSKRQPAQISLSFWLEDREELPSERASTLNISARGLAFRTPKSIPLEARLVLKLHGAPGGRPLQIKGTVCRIEKPPGAATVVYGVVFDQIDRKDQSLLDEFVQVRSVNAILSAALLKKSTDVHLMADMPPVFRIEGELSVEDAYPLAAEELQDMVLAILPLRRREAFERDLELDFSFLSQDGVRFRGNVHRNKGHVEASFHVLSAAVRTVAELGLPPVLEDLSRRRRGLILISGPAGSGTSTTLAVLIDLINRSRRCLILTLEDPIEFVHRSKLAVVKQREIGLDTLSSQEGLKRALRQDADVILAGEFRDAETISTALAAAEAGRLVLGSLPAADVTGCLDRLLGAFPDDQQEGVRGRLAGCLEAVVAQVLVPRSDGNGRVPATEVLVTTPDIRNLIRSGQIEEIPGALEAGEALGMHTLDGSLLDLVRRRIVSGETALSYARDFKRLRAALGSA